MPHSVQSKPSAGGKGKASSSNIFGTVDNRQNMVNPALHIPNQFPMFTTMNHPVSNHHHQHRLPTGPILRAPIVAQPDSVQRRPVVRAIPPTSMCRAAASWISRANECIGGNNSQHSRYHVAPVNGCHSVSSPAVANDPFTGFYQQHQQQHRADPTTITTTAAAAREIPPREQTVAAQQQPPPPPSSSVRLPATGGNGRVLIDSHSRLQHFLWDDFGPYNIPVLLRQEDDRYVSKAMMEIMISQVYSRASSYGPWPGFEKPLTALKPTEAELMLLRRIVDFHMNGVLGKLQIDQNIRHQLSNDMLIPWEDFLDIICVTKSGVAPTTAGCNSKNMKTVCKDTANRTECASLAQSQHAQSHTVQAGQISVLPMKRMAGPSTRSLQGRACMGWVQINNVFLPFVATPGTTSKLECFEKTGFFVSNTELSFAGLLEGHFVPNSILMDCPSLTTVILAALNHGTNSLKSSLSRLVTADELLRLNSLVHEACVASDYMPKETVVVSVRHLVALTPNLLVKFLLRDSPRRFVVKDFAAVLAIKSGIIKLNERITVPFIMSEPLSPHIRMTKDWMNANNFAHDTILIPTSLVVRDLEYKRARLKPIQRQEGEAFDMLTMYLSPYLTFIDPSDNLIALSDLVALNNMQLNPSMFRILFLSQFQHAQQSKLLKMMRPNSMIDLDHPTVAALCDRRPVHGKPIAQHYQQSRPASSTDLTRIGDRPVLPCFEDKRSSSYMTTARIQADAALKSNSSHFPVRQLQNGPTATTSSQAIATEADASSTLFGRPLNSQVNLTETAARLKVIVKPVEIHGRMMISLSSEGKSPRVPVAEIQDVFPRLKLDQLCKRINQCMVGALQTFSDAEMEVLKCFKMPAGANQCVQSTVAGIIIQDIQLRMDAAATSTRTTPTSISTTAAVPTKRLRQQDNNASGNRSTTRSRNRGAPPVPARQCLSRRTAANEANKRIRLTLKALNTKTAPESSDDNGGDELDGEDDDDDGPMASTGGLSSTAGVHGRNVTSRDDDVDDLSSETPSTDSDDSDVSFGCRQRNRNRKRWK